MDSYIRESFTLGGVPDGALHEERGYLGVCACVLWAELAVEEPALA